MRFVILLGFMMFFSVVAGAGDGEKIDEIYSINKGDGNSGIKWCCNDGDEEPKKEKEDNNNGQGGGTDGTGTNKSTPINVTWKNRINVKCLINEHEKDNIHLNYVQRESYGDMSIYRDEYGFHGYYGVDLSISDNFKYHIDISLTKYNKERASVSTALQIVCKDIEISGATLIEVHLLDEVNKKKWPFLLKLLNVNNHSMSISCILNINDIYRILLIEDGE